MNTKYISSSELKTSECSRVRSTGENFYVFNSRDETHLVFTENKNGVAIDKRLSLAIFRINRY